MFIRGVPSNAYKTRNKNIKKKQTKKKQKSKYTLRNKFSRGPRIMPLEISNKILEKRIENKKRTSKPSKVRLSGDFHIMPIKPKVKNN